MNTCLSKLLPIICCLLPGLALAFDIPQARSEARLLAQEDRRILALHTELRASLVGVLSAMTDSRPYDMTVRWQDKAGVDPEPFQVFIPTGCWVNEYGRWLVEDFTACGVRATYATAGSGPMLVPLKEFEASLRSKRDRSLQLDLRLLATDRAPAGELLSVIGGASLQVIVGEESGAADLLGVETVMGVDPEPF